ncbi:MULTISPECIES: ABC transporter permease [Paenibacillus]|uniref:ABC transporter permease n=1 Tax=Paenibacillus TaxID=44249 RepID=UPI0019119291|nr:ABC-2 family transporter protein [Paenibacillus sp. FJAT-26967]
MRTLLFYFKIYLKITSQYFKVKMQYRADFIISSIGMLVTNLVGILPLWIIFNSVSSLEGFTYYEILFIYSFSLIALSPLQLFFDNIWNLWTHLIDGTFIKYYLKPINVMFYYMSEVFDIKGLSQLAFGAAGLIYASVQLGLSWNLVSIVLLLIALLGSSLIMVSLMIMAAATGFWITNPFHVIAFVFRFREIVKYPVTIFNNFFKFLFTFILPIGFVAFYPSQLFLKSFTDADLLAYCSPLVGVLLFSLAYLAWNKAIKSYSGTGS